METVTEFVKNAVCSLPVTAAILLAGVYFTFRSRFFVIFKIKKIIKGSVSSFRNSAPGVSPMSAFATALGGTVGVGSIFGMGYAVSEGGAGSIFWMWVCAFFSMTVKYSETFLAVKYREVRGESCSGGAMYILKNVIGGKAGKIGAVFFCVCCIGASFGCGNMAQTVVLSSLLSQSGIHRAATAAAVALLASLIVFKGGERIEKVNSFLIPAASVSYFLITALLLIQFRDRIPYALSGIVTQAFGTKQLAGGVTGYAISAAFREGSLRGTFSHEAGMGSSPIAHASSVSASPETQGMLGIAEIFIDTFIVGTMTAVCLIASGYGDIGAMFGYSLGGAGSVYLICAVSVFAFGAILSWCFYGEKCVGFLHGEKRAPHFIYKAAVIIFAFCGCLMTSQTAYGIADIFNYLMMIPNMYLLFKLRRQITYG